MIDLGFSPTMTRVTAFIWAGAREIQPMGVPTLRDAQVTNAAPNYRLLAELVRTMQLYYRAAGAIVTDVQGVDARLPSGPLHDAARVAEAGVPTVMLFVRSKRGLSHTREEDTDEADLELALTALERLVRGELERRS